MSISNVTITDGCTSCGLCVQKCPEVFELQGTAKVKSGVNFNEFGNKIRDAADSCPAQVIKVG